MYRRILTSFISLSLLVVLISGCSKSDVISNENDLIGTWVVTGISSNIAADWNGDGYTETDIFNNYDYCQRDIALVFDYNGNGQSRQGCNSYWQSMYWQLLNNNQTLNINLQGDDIKLDLIQFSPSMIRGEDQVYANGQNYIITYTLARR